MISARDNIIHQLKFIFKLTDRLVQLLALLALHLFMFLINSFKIYKKNKDDNEKNIDFPNYRLLLIAEKRKLNILRNVR